MKTKAKRAVKPHKVAPAPRRRTQRQRAEALIKQLKAGDLEIENALWALLGEASAKGHPDGSITFDRGKALLDIATALALLKSAFSSWQFAQ